MAFDGLLAGAHRIGRRRRNLCSPAGLVAHNTTASSSACGPSPLSSGRRIALRRVAEIPAASKNRRDRPLPTLDFSFVYLDGLDVVARKKVSPELSVQRSARERVVKACDKFGIPVNPRKSLVDAAVGSVLGGELDGRLGHLSHERKTSAEMPIKTIILIGALGWSEGPLQHFAGLWASWCLPDSHPLLFSVRFTERFTSTWKTAG